MGEFQGNIMIAILYGKDRFRVMRRRSELKKKFHSEHPDGEIVPFDVTAPGTFSKYLSEATATDLFGSRRFLDVGDIFSVPDDVSEKMAVAISDADFSSVDSVFFSVATPKAKDPVFAALRKKADLIEEWKTLAPAEAGAFIDAEAKSSGGGATVSRAAKEKMISLFGNDSAKLSSLTEVLVTYKESGEVSLADLELFVSETPKELVFAALDALVSGNRGKAVAMLLREAREDSGGVPKLFGLLAWQLRELIKVRGEYDKGNMSAAGIAAACGMKPFVAGKLLSRISGFPLVRLRGGFDLLSSLDGDMKLGRKDPELALTLFVEKF